jgi:hypothetical protein
MDDEDFQTVKQKINEQGIIFSDYGQLSKFQQKTVYSTVEALRSTPSSKAKKAGFQGYEHYF